MAYRADDGSMHTNRPHMVAHNARMKVAPQGKPASAGDSAHEEREKSLIAEMGAMHGLSVTCPQCGHSFEPEGHDASDEQSSVPMASHGGR